MSSTRWYAIEIDRFVSRGTEQKRNRWIHVSNGHHPIHDRFQSMFQIVFKVKCWIVQRNNRSIESNSTIDNCRIKVPEWEIGDDFSNFSIRYLSGCLRISLGQAWHSNIPNLINCFKKKKKKIGIVVHDPFNMSFCWTRAMSSKSKRKSLYYLLNTDHKKAKPSNRKITSVDKPRLTLSSL